MAKKTTHGGGLVELPADPMAGIDVLITYYKDRSSVPVGEVGHAALHILAYGYGQFHAHPVELKAGPVPACPDDCPDCNDDEECLKLLEKTKETRQSGSDEGVGAIPWATIFALAMQILMKLFPDQF